MTIFAQLESGLTGCSMPAVDEQKPIGISAEVTMWWRSALTGAGHGQLEIDDQYVEFDDHYWGTDEEWERLENESMSAEEFDRISAYLDETGQASA